MAIVAGNLTEAFAHIAQTFVNGYETATASVGPIMIEATTHADTDSSPLEESWPTPEQITAWKNDEWRYVGISLTASIGNVSSDASLWGIAFGIGSDSDFLVYLRDEVISNLYTEARSGLADAAKVGLDSATEILADSDETKALADLVATAQRVAEGDSDPEELSALWEALRFAVKRWPGVQLDRVPGEAPTK